MVWLIVDDPGDRQVGGGDALFSTFEGYKFQGTISGREWDFVKNDPILAPPILSTIIYTGGVPPKRGGKSKIKGSI